MRQLLQFLDPLFGSGYSIGRIVPPYTEVRTLVLDDLAPASLLPGTILVLRSCREPSPECPRLAAAIGQLRTKFPAVPVVAELGALSPAALDFAAMSPRLNLRAVLLRGAPPEPHLRSALTRTHQLGREAVEWLRLRRIPLSPTLSHAVRHLVAGGARATSLTQLLRAARTAPSSLRSRLRRKQLPSPASWHRLGRALHVAVRIQASPRKSLLLLAHECGHGDHAALIRQFTGCFGIRPATVRGTLGWEWLLERWVDRQLATGAVATVEWQGIPAPGGATPNDGVRR